MITNGPRGRKYCARWEERSTSSCTASAREAHWEAAARPSRLAGLALESSRWNQPEQTLLAGECPRCHFIEGVADGFVPALLRDAPVDDHYEVKSADAMAATRRLHGEFGLLVGTSSGANRVVALRLAAELGPQATVVTLLSDQVERYFGAALFEEKA